MCEEQKQDEDVKRKLNGISDGRKQQQYHILIQILLVTDNEHEDARRDEADTAREGKLASAILTTNSVNNTLG